MNPTFEINDYEKEHAAILRHFVSRFGPRPLMVTDRIGLGIGTREFAEHANLVRAFLGEAE